MESNSPYYQGDNNDLSSNKLPTIQLVPPKRKILINSILNQPVKLLTDDWE